MRGRKWWCVPVLSSEVHGRLIYPIADLLASLCGQTGESQTSLLSHFIIPCQFRIRFDLEVRLGEAEMDGPSFLNGKNGAKAEPSFRNIQDDAAVTGLQSDISKPFHGHPWELAAFRVHH